MNSENNVVVSYATDADRATFFKKTYSHVAYAILAFMLVESILLRIVPMEWILMMMGGKFVWLFILGLFWLGSTLSDRLVFHPDRDKQYLGLGLYVLLQAIIFLPMIAIAVLYSGTMSAAIEAAMEGIPAIGFSLCDFAADADFSHCHDYIIKICQQVLVHGLPKGLTLNVNFPAHSSMPLPASRAERHSTKTRTVAARPTASITVSVE